MENFAKGTAFFIFGVLCSPILLGLFAPFVAYEITNSPLVAGITAVVSFSLWAISREWMINRKWHYHV